MGRPRTWTDDDLRAAVANSTSVKATMVKLGLRGTGDNHYEVKARIKGLSLDVSHFRNSSVAGYAWSEPDLRAAVIDAPNRSAVLQRLGLQLETINFARLDRHLKQLGLKISFSGHSRRPRRWTDDQLRAAVATSHGVASTLRQLGLVAAGGNYDQVQKRIKELELDISHFRGTSWCKGQKLPFRPVVPLEQVLVAGRYTSSQALKERLLRAGLKQPACEICGWAQRSPDGRLPIELDHINGDKTDNRIENLRILCPNCHSLQPTHRGSNHRSRRR